MSHTSTSAPATRRASVDVPRWLPALTTALCIVGLGVSIYLTFEHYTGNASLACSDSGVINCAKVTTSPESKIVGIPVAVLGLVFFVGMLPLQLPASWRAGAPWSNLRVAGLVIGVGMVAYLVYTELVTIDAICLWCTVVHIVVVLLFVLTVIGAALADPTDRA